MHDIGELWCAVLMSLGRRLGRWETIQIVVDQLKLTAANPSLLAARDAILLAAGQYATARGDDETECALFVSTAWQVFARYGMSPGARTDGAELSGIVADFNAPAQPSTALVSASAEPGLSIPDADPDGVVSTLQLPDAGPVRGLHVRVDIAHTYRGDLVVTLVAPGGRSAVLHNRAGGSANDLHETYDSEALPARGALEGAAAGGQWSLRVADRARVGVGRLDAWSLAADAGYARPAVQLDAPGGTHRPERIGRRDDRRTGRGPARNGERALAGPRPDPRQVGDLSIALNGPAGKRVTVHRRGSADSDHLITGFGSAPGSRSLPSWDSAPRALGSSR